jgi:hypothetical protein
LAHVISVFIQIHLVLERLSCVKNKKFTIKFCIDELNRATRCGDS